MVVPSYESEKKSSERQQSSSIVDEDMVNVEEDISELIDPINEAIYEINDASEEMRDELDSWRMGHSHERMVHLDELTAHITALITATQPSIKQLRQAITDATPNSDSDTEETDQSGVSQTQRMIRRNLYTSKLKQFFECVNTFHSLCQEFEDVNVEDMTRILSIIGGNQEVTADQLAAVEMARQDPRRFVQAQFRFDEEGMTEEEREYLQELEEERVRVLDIEKKMVEMNQLMNALAAVVSDTQSKLDQIETNVENTRENVEAAGAHIQKAREYRSKTRKTQMKIAVCCCICVVILVLICLFAFKIIKT